MSKEEELTSVEAVRKHELKMRRQKRIRDEKGMYKPHEYSEADVINAVAHAAGVIEYAAVKLGCNWECARKYINKYPRAKELLEVGKCKLNALAMRGYHRALANGDRWAIERALDTVAKRNGYNLNATNHLGDESDKDAAPVRVNIEIMDASQDAIDNGDDMEIEAEEIVDE